MTIKHYIAFGLVIAIMGSCERKELPKPIIEEPVFFMSGDLNDVSFFWAAGNDGLYADSYILEDEWGIHHYSAGLVPYGCDACAGRFMLSLSGTTLTNPWEPIEFDQDVQIGNYPFASINPLSDFQTVQFWSGPLIFENILWDFGNGQTSTDLNPVMTYSSSEPVLVTWVANGAPCNSTISQTIGVGTGEPLCVPMDIIWLDANTLLVSNIPDVDSYGLTLTGVYLDGNSLTFNNDPLLISTTTNEEHTLLFTFVNGEGVEGLFRATSTFEFDLCYFPFVWTFTPQSEPELGVAAVQYIHSNGQEYTSINPANQGAGSSFEIVSIEDYHVSLDGRPTKKVRANFACTLFNVNDATDTIELSNVTGDFLFVVSD